MSENTINLLSEALLDAIRNLRGALATIHASTEPDAIKHRDYEHLAASICAVCSAALDGNFIDDMGAAEIYDKLKSQQGKRP